MARALAVLLVGLIPLGCDSRGGKSDRPPSTIDQKPTPVKPEELAAIVSANNAFAVDFYTHIRGEPGNVLFSPYSISSAFAMAYGGARQMTAAQIAKNFYFPEDRSLLHPAFVTLRNSLQGDSAPGRPRLETINALWFRRGIALRPEFTSLMQSHYEAALKSVDFAKDRESACLGINEWIRDQSHGRIGGIVNAATLDPQVRLLLVSATYFQAEWQKQFDPRLTVQADFFPPTGAPIRAFLMRDVGLFQYGEDTNGQVLDLPYIGGDWVMTIFLPRHRAGLPAFEKDFTLAKLDALRTQSPKDVRVWLPRFVIDAEYDLRTTLSAQGLALPFTPEAADFRGMADAKDVSIGAAVHKTFVEVTEKGTEAAVATAQLPEIKKTGDDAAVFRADHPFFFVIRDRKTGAIVFIGRVLRPL